MVVGDIGEKGESGKKRTGNILKCINIWHLVLWFVQCELSLMCSNIPDVPWYEACINNTIDTVLLTLFYHDIMYLFLLLWYYLTSYSPVGVKSVILIYHTLHLADFICNLQHKYKANYVPRKFLTIKHSGKVFSSHHNM